MPNLKDSTVSLTSKVGLAFGIPARTAETCPLGSLLGKIEGSVCRSCYAAKRRYTVPNVKAKLERNLTTLQNTTWREFAFILAFDIQRTAAKRFRFLHSGDIRRVDDIRIYVAVAEMLPDVEFWLPTRERKILDDYIRERGWRAPDNLTIRLSDAMVDKPAPAPTIPGVRSSGVHKLLPAVGYSCPAATAKSCEAAGCSACWDKSVDRISYQFH
jgi:hypothetical protein